MRPPPPPPSRPPATPARGWSRLLLLGLWAGAVLTGLTACRHTGPKFDPLASLPDFVAVNETNAIRPEWRFPPKEPFRLGPGDRIEIEILGRTGSRTSTFVCPDGKIYYDLLPGLDVWSLTLRETKDLLDRELGAYYKHAQVVVSLQAVESKCVWVLGRLNRSGVFPLNQPMTVIEAVARAGGLFTSRMSGTTEELADLNHSFLIRGGQMVPVNFKKLLREGDTSQNIYLQPDDFLYLPSSLSREVYVLGAVNRPAPVGFMDNMTVLSVIAKALGPAPDARLGEVAIVRGALTDPKIALVNVRAIMKGRAPDVRLQPRDIVYVPLSPYRTIERYAKMVRDTFVRTVAANEGGHAGASGQGNIGVVNPLVP